MSISEARLFMAELISDFMAELISDGHECYLPIFERLEQEFQKQQASQSLLDKARLLAQKKPTFDNHSAF